MKLPALSECNPGFEPFEFNVVIAPEEMEERSVGGIILPDQVKETEGLAKVRGLLVAVSPAAFNYADWPEGTRLPQPGDHVIYARYAGTETEGADGRTYRLAKDRDVAAIIRRD